MDRSSHRIRPRTLRIYSFELKFMNKFVTICYERKCSSDIYLLLACKCECDPSQSGRASIQRFHIDTMLLDALQCSFIKFHRSFFVESNKAILPINCIIPLLGGQCMTAGCTTRRPRRTQTHTKRTKMSRF